MAEAGRRYAGTQLGRGDRAVEDRSLRSWRSPRSYGPITRCCACRSVDLSFDVEEAIRANHDERKANDGQADWLVRAVTPLGVRIEAIYDHPVGNDEASIRVVSAWRVES